MRKSTVILLWVLIIMILTLGTATALGVLTGYFRVGQDEVGSISDITTMNGNLYLLSSGGIFQWIPEKNETQLLISLQNLEKFVFSDHSLLFSMENGLGLIDQVEKRIWAYSENTLSLILDYKGSKLDDSNVVITSVVYQDGMLILRATKENLLENDGVLLCYNMNTGIIEDTMLSNVVEVCSGPSGFIYVMQRDLENKQDTILACNLYNLTDNSVIYCSTIQEVRGLAYDVSNAKLYASVKGAISYYQTTDWFPVSDYSLQWDSEQFEVFNNTYVASSYRNLQFVPLTVEDEMNALTIRGFRAIDDVDANFQDEHGIAVIRHNDPYINASAVRELILAGDTTDLFYVCIDADLIEMFRDGKIASLDSSALLVTDTMQMIEPYVRSLFVNGKLYAVPNLAYIWIWKANGDIPRTLANLITEHLQWNENNAYLSGSGDNAAWDIHEYADYLLTTYITEATSAGGEINFHAADFVDTLVQLKKLAYKIDGNSYNDALAPSILARQELRLHGELPTSTMASNIIDYVSIFRENGGTDQVNWKLPPAISQQAPSSVPAELYVYVLNPNAMNPEAAFSYLEYIATHRSVETEALLKPQEAQPTLNPAVVRELEWIYAQEGLADIPSVQEEIVALQTVPFSWIITELRLQYYKKFIVPHISLSLHPLLSQSSKREGGTYECMLAAIHDYLSDSIELSICIEKIDILYQNMIE